MRVPQEGSSSSTPVINEASSYCENKHQRKEPTTITDLSRRKDVSVIVGSTENNSLVTGAAGTGGGNHTCRALLQIHRAGRGGSHLLKAAGSTAGGGYGWRRGCGWLWMGFVETRSVVLALPLSKTRRSAPHWCQWDRPLHTRMVSALSSSSGSVLHTQIQLHTTPHPHYI